MVITAVRRSGAVDASCWYTLRIIWTAFRPSSSGSGSSCSGRSSGRGQTDTRRSTSASGWDVAGLLSSCVQQVAHCARACDVVVEAVFATARHTGAEAGHDTDAPAAETSAAAEYAAAAAARESRHDRREHAKTQPGNLISIDTVGLLENLNPTSPLQRASWSVPVQSPVGVGPLAERCELIHDGV